MRMYCTSRKASWISFMASAELYFHTTWNKAIQNHYYYIIWCWLCLKILFSLWKLISLALYNAYRSRQEMQASLCWPNNTTSSPFSQRTRPVGSGAAWRRSPHQKSAGREGEKRKRGRKEREKRRKKRGEKGKKGRGEQEKLREKDVLRLWV